METRSRARQEIDAVIDTPIAMDSLPHVTSTLIHSSTQSTGHQPDMGWNMDPSDVSSEHPIDFMRQLESIGWNGGEHFFGGKRDEFCFVCGGSMELFGCQTCETCYHASCMSPTLEPEEVPSFWFCPHCVDREFHVPPEPPTAYFTPVTSPEAAPPSSSILGQGLILSDQSPKAQSNPRKIPEGQMIDVAASRKKVNEVSRSASLDTKFGTNRNTPKITQPKAPLGRTRRSNSPPKKRSKYSAFSSEVDKALAVIHKELESAAGNSKSEDSLKERVQTLEQELRLKDGQILLATRELEVARRNGDTARLKAEIQELKAQNDKLKSLVEMKDGELKDWRTKLKTLLGNEG